MDTQVSDILKSENINEDLYYIGILDGAKCKSLKSFLKEIGKVFNFPSYYGQNLNALYECLNDLEWLDKRNYFLLIKNSEIFLKDESTEVRDHILSSLKRVTEEWANVPNYDGEEIYRHKADFRIKLA